MYVLTSAAKSPARRPLWLLARLNGSERLNGPLISTPSVTSSASRAAGHALRARRAAVRARREYGHNSFDTAAAAATAGSHAEDACTSSSPSATSAVMLLLEQSTLGRRLGRKTAWQACVGQPRHAGHASAAGDGSRDQDGCGCRGANRRARRAGPRRSHELSTGPTAELAQWQPQLAARSCRRPPRRRRRGVACFCQRAVRGASAAAVCEAARARDSSAASGIVARSVAATLGTAHRARCRGRRLATKAAAAASRAAARIMRPPPIPDGAGARHPARRATARVRQHAAAGPGELGSQAVQ